MTKIGYALSSEEYEAADLVRHAQAAETAGFDFAFISDHFHPWTRRQGNSPFVWTVLGAIAQVTEHIRIGTAVTCPTVRTHLAIIAHATATAALMSSGRFDLGIGSGENLNEHITGAKWPAPRIRLEMLEEAINVIFQLWKGGDQNFYGKHYQVENARIFSLPKQRPSLLMAAAKKCSARLAGRLADGLITTSPEPHRGIRTWRRCE